MYHQQCGFLCVFFLLSVQLEIFKAKGLLTRLLVGLTSGEMKEREIEMKLKIR